MLGTKQSNERKQINLIREAYDKIHSTAKSITEAYGSKYIPLITLTELVDKSKMKDNPVLGDFPEKYNHTLDLLFTTCKNYCNDHGLEDRLPMIVLEQYIGVLKEGLTA